jgi:hypothetical protein
VIKHNNNLPLIDWQLGGNQITKSFEDNQELIVQITDDILHA